MAIQLRGAPDGARWVATRTLFAIICVVPATVALALLLHGAGSGGQVGFGAALRYAVEISLAQSLALCAVLSAYDLSLWRRFARARTDLERQAWTDQLTGLLNRRGLDTMSARASAADGTLSRPAAALMCDIDFFKAVNDRHGHEFGDAALRSVAELLREFAAGRDAILGRQGGEEFVVLLFDAGLAEAAALARAIREACAARPIAWGGATASVTVSIGVAAAAAGTTTPPRLVSLADAALYDAKRGGRDRVALAA